MAFDFKKEFKEYYRPKKDPGIIEIPEMKFLAVRGSGDPNEQEGLYQKAISLLYGVSYTLKMSQKNGYCMEGFFEYTVPPLEGLWWQDDVDGADYSRKDTFQWISLIRLPDFVSEKDFLWAKETAAKKKKLDFSSVEYFRYQEGLCVQCMHEGPFDDEPATIRRMDEYAEREGYRLDISDHRFHHEIYLKDARKCDPSRFLTVIRHPITRI